MPALAPIHNNDDNAHHGLTAKSARAGAGAKLAAATAAGRLSLQAAANLDRETVIGWRDAFALLWPQDAASPKKDRIRRLVQDGRVLAGFDDRVRLPVYPTLGGMAFRLGDVLDVIAKVQASHAVEHPAVLVSAAAADLRHLSRVAPVSVMNATSDRGGQLPARRECRQRPTREQALRLVGGGFQRKEALGRLVDELA